MPKVLISDKLSPRAADILSERGVEVDDRDGPDPPEALGDGEGVPGVQGVGLSADELHGLAAHDVDGWDDHVLTSMPDSRRASLTCPQVMSLS